MATNGDPEIKAKADHGLCCLLCTETFRKPKTLVCTHTFCESCLQTHARKLDEDGSLVGALICPDETCKKYTPMASGGFTDELVESLPTNLALLTLLEECQGQDDAEGTLQVESTICGPCLKLDIKAVASHFCVNCDEFQCSQCSSIHERFAFSMGHYVTTVELMTEKKIIQRIGRPVDVCDVHLKPLEFYCKDHKKLCCSTCAIITHRGCEEVVEIADIAKESKSDTRFRPLQKKFVALKQTVDDTSAFLESKEQQVKCQFDMIPDKIEATRQNILEKIAELKKQVTTTANDALNEHVEEINARRCLCKELTNKIHSTLHKYESYVHNGSPAQQFIAVEKLNQLYTCLQTEVRESLVKITSLTFDIEYSDLLKQAITTESFGKILVNTKEIYVESVLNAMSDLTLKKSVELPKVDKYESLLTGLAFLSDGRLVAADNKNCQLILFDSDLVVLAKLKIQGSPLGVTASSDNEVIITGTNRLLRFQINNSNQIEEKGAITVPSKYYSVSSMKLDTYLVGVYDAERPACVVSDKGVETKLDITFKQRNYGLRDTRCCYSDLADCVILTERYTNTVFIYGRSDKTELEVRDATIMEPRGVAVSNQGFIFVCSTGKDFIVQISPSGSIISSTRCEMMTKPRTVCVHPDGTLLAVANNGSKRCLQIYNIGL